MILRIICKGLIGLMVDMMLFVVQSFRMSQLPVSRLQKIAEGGSFIQLKVYAVFAVTQNMDVESQNQTGLKEQNTRDKKS